MARFSSLISITLDISGNFIVVDLHRIRKVDNSLQSVTTIAGGGWASNSFGYQDGAGTNALFYNPRQVGVDSNGIMYVVDRNNFAVRKITSSGLRRI